MLSSGIDIKSCNNLIKSTDNITDLNKHLLHALFNQDLYVFYFSVYIPICYRLGNISLGLNFADKGFKSIDPKKHSYYHKIYNSIDSSSYNDLILEITNIFSSNDAHILDTSARIKGAYSMAVKNINKNLIDFHDIYGLEFLIDEDIFFSSGYIDILKKLFELPYVQGISDLSVKGGLYKNLPCTIVKLKINNQSMQLKIRPIGYKYSEYGTVYFIYKGYNIDNMVLSNKLEIFRILKLSQLEKQSKSLYEAMYLELKHFNYLHAVRDDSIDCAFYINRLKSFRKRITPLCSNNS